MVNVLENPAAAVGIANHRVCASIGKLWLLPLGKN